MDAPLVSEQVVVPAYVHGKGPYLFVLAPDARVTTIDRGLAQELKLFSPANSWTAFIDTSDREVRLRQYEILEMQLGQLHLRNFKVYGAKAGSLEVAGRKVHGVIGGNILTRTVVVDIDRDRGRVVLGLDPNPPRGAVRLGGLRRRSRKIVVPARVEGQRVELAVDLSVPHTGMRFDAFELLPGRSYAQSLRWTDEFGTRVSSTESKRLRCSLGAALGFSIAFATHPDERLFYHNYHGVLGQDFLARHRVVFNADGRELWLSPRATNLGAHVGERLDRWGRTFESCRANHCGELDYAAPSRVLIVRPAPELDNKYDVFLEAQDRHGQGIAGALLRVTVDPSVREHRLSPSELSPVFAGAHGFRIVDLSPVESGCERGCVEPTAVQEPAVPWKSPALRIQLASETSGLYLLGARR